MATDAQPAPRRWFILVFIALAQLIIAIDLTVVNVALPSVQAGLGMSDQARQWVVAAYTLAFGGLLVTGGRVADRVGHKRSFVAGLCVFALASALGGVADNGAVLIVARVLQGMAGAVLSPSALALVTTTFTDTRERAKAFGIYSAVASGGLVAGLIIGGLLTQYASWRWAFHLSAWCAVVAALGGLVVVPAVRPAQAPGRLDLPGALLSSGGLVALVVALSGVRGSGWPTPSTLITGGVAIVALTAFVAVEKRVDVPLLPLRVLNNRSRLGVYLAVLLALTGLFGLFLLTTFYLQDIRGFAPMLTGLAFLPLVISMAVGATQIAGRLPHVPPRILVSGGLALAMCAVLMMTGLQVDSGYFSLFLPAMILLGLGLGMVFVPSTNLATGGVAPADSGVASAVFVTVQQLGAAIGTVVTNGAATAGFAEYVRAHPSVAASDPAAVIYGFTTALWWTVGLLAAGMIVTIVLVRDREMPSSPRTDPVTEGRLSSSN